MRRWRGWYDCFEYKIAEADGFVTSTGSYPYGGINPGASFNIYVGLRDGGGDNNTLTSWGVHLNPDFHTAMRATGSRRGPERRTAW